MQILVASDSPSTSNEVRDVLLQIGYECPEGHVVPVARAIDAAARVRPDAILLGLSPDVEGSLGILRELNETIPAQVLCVGPASDPQLILHCLRDGGFQYVDETELEKELPPALQRLGPNRTAAEEHGRLIAVLAPSGGSGASTLAVNIATTLASEHEKCGLLDLKLETGDLATLLNVRPAHSLADFCSNLTRMDQNMFEQCFIPHSSGVSLLASPFDFADVQRVTEPGVRKAIAMARARYPYVVADVDHSYRQEHAPAIYLADIVVLVLRLDITSLRQTRRSLAYLEGLGIGLDRVQLVANRWSRHSELRISQVEKALGSKISHAIPDDPKTLKKANYAGTTVVTAKPHTRVARSMTELAMSVNGMHKTS